MSGNDYVKFVTQQIVSYMDRPKEDRKMKKKQKESATLPVLNRWFGVIPFALMLLFNKKRK